MLQKFKQEHDYINQPKPDGYRGLHLIYRYVGRYASAWEGLQIEIQLRSRLQHAWATAVETVDTLQKQALKIGGGSPEWRRFFQLMGSVMAIREGATLVPGTPASEQQLVAELRELSGSLRPEEKLTSYKKLITQTTERISGAKYFLLELRPSEQKVEVTGFKKGEVDEATNRYLELEKLLGERGDEAVLVSVGSFSDLLQAYPNYFLDTELFLDAWRKALE